MVTRLALQKGIASVENIFCRKQKNILDGSQVGVFEQGDEVSLGGFLQGHDGRGLESQVGLEVLSDFSNQSLEGELSDQELGRLLVLSDFSEGDGTGPVSVGLLDTTGRGLGGLSGGLGGELLSGSLTTGRLSCGLPGGWVSMLRVIGADNGLTWFGPL
jgi:histone H3